MLAAPEGPPLQECLQHSTVATHKFRLKLGGGKQRLARCCWKETATVHLSAQQAPQLLCMHACSWTHSGLLGHSDAPLQKCHSMGQALRGVGIQQVADHPGSLLLGKGAGGVDIQQQLAGAQDRQHC